MTHKLLQDQAIFHQKGQALTTKLLASLSKEELTKERGSYYKNLEAIYSHLVGGEIFFLNCIAKALPNLKIEVEELSDLEFAVASKKNEVICDLLIKLTKELSSEELATYVDFHGYDISVASVFLKLFTHATHHRGQVSQVLDEMSIEHDLIRMTPL